jgi:molybdenum cofactor synthesis domain-containing protein
LEFELFEKTEIWIKPIQIKKANLTVVAEKVAEILKLKKSEVLVVDVRDDLICLDILKKTVNPRDIIGKKKEILDGMREIPGIYLFPETTIHSEGILGLIDLEDQKVTEDLLEKMEKIGEQISDHIKKRAIVFPSGFEVKKGLIQDTNSPYIAKRLKQEGINVTIGETLEDEVKLIVPALIRAINDGFGLIITTGGVGAEKKDRMIEAILELDPEASTPYIIHYEKGTGRHEKDGVKIGVGYVRPSLIIALPGPHEEVKIAVEAIIEGLLKKNMSKEELALSLSQKLAQSLRKIHYSI